MKLRFAWLCASVFGLAGTLLGCDSMRQERRAKSDEPRWDSPETPDKDESIAPKGFYKSTRLSGAMSDEAREVESHFGIH